MQQTGISWEGQHTSSSMLEKSVGRGLYALMPGANRELKIIFSIIDRGFAEQMAGITGFASIVLSDSLQPVLPQGAISVALMR